MAERLLDMQHRAIETRYKGYRFRSRLEARWAVFFDALGLRWEYEPEGFELPSGRYLPDFRVGVNAPVWVEIKPAAPAVTELQKLRELCGMMTQYGLLFAGLPDAQQWVAVHKCGHVHDSGGLAGYNSTGEPAASYLGTHWRDFEYAAPAARSARFEFGESGAR